HGGAKQLSCMVGQNSSVAWWGKTAQLHGGAKQLSFDNEWIEMPCSQAERTLHRISAGTLLAPI
ncbi:MAG: hypothetical protein QF391_06835, partial [Myxococcota bacterium]|nr:hypothetical protein [Myxococcota bacterium]